jgi:hypothetical protein
MCIVFRPTGRKNDTQRIEDQRQAKGPIQKYNVPRCRRLKLLCQVVYAKINEDYCATIIA